MEMHKLGAHRPPGVVSEERGFFYLGFGTWCCSSCEDYLCVFFFQNSKSTENWIWRAPMPATGCLNSSIEVRPDPKTGLTSETFARFSRLKASATTSRRLTPLNEKYFSARKSRLASAGIFKEFLPSPSGREDSGNA